MYLKRPAVGLVFCLFYLSFYFTNKYVLTVLKFTYPTLFQGWQTLVGGFLLHVSWKVGWVELGSSSRSEVLSWLPASVFFVGIIYAGSRALSRLPIPVFFILHNAAEVLTCGIQRCTQKEPIPVFFILHNAAEVLTCGIQRCTQKEQLGPAKLWSALFLLMAAGCLPLHDAQYDSEGYFWAVIHLICVGSYKVFRKSHKSSAISDLDQQYINYIFSVLLLAFASHPSGDLFSALEFPFLYFYRFHSGCCASGILGFILMLTTVKLKSSLSSGHYASWSFLAKVVTAGLSTYFFDIILNVPTVCCLLLGAFGEGLLVYADRTNT